MYFELTKIANLSPIKKPIQEEIPLSFSILCKDSFIFPFAHNSAISLSIACLFFSLYLKGSSIIVKRPSLFPSVDPTYDRRHESSK